MKIPTNAETRKKLVWKQFWEQKRRELLIVGLCLLVVIGLVCIIYGLGYVGCETGMVYNCGTVYAYDYLASGMAMCAIILFFGCLTIMPIVLIVMWIRENWKTANETIDKRHPELGGGE